MTDSNHVSGACTPSMRRICLLRRLISSSRKLKIIPKTRLKHRHFKPWMLAWRARFAEILDAQVMIARKPKKRRCFWTTTMGFIHKKVRGGINHTHTIKGVMKIQIRLILTNLPSGIWSTAKRRPTRLVLLHKLVGLSLILCSWRLIHSWHRRRLRLYLICLSTSTLSSYSVGTFGCSEMISSLKVCKSQQLTTTDALRMILP